MEERGERGDGEDKGREEEGEEGRAVRVMD